MESIVSRKLLVVLAVVVFTLPMLGGCSDSKTDSKQPQLQGPPDPNVTGPKTPVGGPKAKPQGVQ